MFSLYFSNSNDIPFFCFLFQLEVVSTGWIGIALTFRGDFAGADIIVGWVAEDGAATIVVSNKQR